MSRTPLLWSSVIAAALCGCDGEEPPPVPEPAVCSGDYSQLPAAEVSLERDLMPMFGASCTFSSCHDRSSKKAGLFLGDPSSPIDPTLLMEVRDSLLAPSMTVTAPAVPRVTPGDPTKSFLLDKVTGSQDGRGYTCESQEPSPADSTSCGATMPFGYADYCAENPHKVGAMAAWIRDRAPQN